MSINPKSKCGYNPEFLSRTLVSQVCFCYYDQVNSKLPKSCVCELSHNRLTTNHNYVALRILYAQASTPYPHRVMCILYGSEFHSWSWNTNMHSKKGCFQKQTVKQTNIDLKIGIYCFDFHIQALFFFSFFFSFFFKIGRAHV